MAGAGKRRGVRALLAAGLKKGKGARGTPGESIFNLYSLGVVTARDDWMYGFDEESLKQKVELFIETYNAEVDRWKRRKDREASVDAFVTYDDRRIKWSRDLKLNLEREKYAEFSERKIRKALYRPFKRDSSSTIRSATRSRVSSARYSRKLEPSKRTAQSASTASLRSGLSGARQPENHC